MAAQQEGLAPCVAQCVSVRPKTVMKKKSQYAPLTIWLCLAHALPALVCVFVCFFLSSIDNFCSCRLDEELREASEAAKTSCLYNDPEMSSMEKDIDMKLKEKP